MMSHDIDFPVTQIHLQEERIYASYYQILNEYLDRLGQKEDYIFRPLVNIFETANKFEICFLLPVAAMDNVAVIIKDGYVIVHGQNESQHRVPVRILKKEYDNRNFFRAVPLPVGADPKYFFKRFHHGEFSIIFPRRQHLRDSITKEGPIINRSHATSSPK
ncbi:MAG: hypothetical protein C5B52_09835 [Bacteroidetes bacterium]|nr:MAG: hypothetical protein C5B52_09835 [Bacteroidota bacterium]